jgi:hypothetical protein
MNKTFPLRLHDDMPTFSALKKDFMGLSREF